MLLGDLAGFDLVIAIVVVAILLFGGAAIPKFAKNLGSAKSEFEKGLKEGKNSSSTQATDASETKAPETDK